MINSRSIVETLKKEFQNTEQKSRINNKISIMLSESPGSASRIFDHFTNLLPLEKLTPLSKTFVNILSQIALDPIDEESGNLFLCKPKDKSEISRWVKEISSLAIKELLDKNNHIKDEFIEILELKNFISELRDPTLILSILCGYVSSIIQVIQKNSTQEIEKNYKAYSGFCHCLNTHIRQWVQEQLSDHSISSKYKLPAITNNIAYWSSKNPKTASIMALAVLTAATVVLRQQNSNTSQELLEVKRRLF
jgi:hypothetical protein